MSATAKHQCLHCGRPLRRVDYGVREFWRCVGWFDTGNPCFAAFDDVAMTEELNVEELDWPTSDDKKLH